MPFKKGHISWNKGIKTGITYWRGKKMPPRTDSYKKKLSIALLGHKVSEKVKIKLRKFRLGKKHLKETIEKIRTTSIGRRHSEETKNKMSVIAKANGNGHWNKGNPLSEQNKINIGLANKGKKKPSISGEKNHNWKGGITPINAKIRHSLKANLWREAVFKRDNFVCQKYSNKGGKLVAHHINNFADFPELRFLTDNGITLSQKAHLEFHKKYGKKNNTEEQLKEFLKPSKKIAVAIASILGIVRQT